MPPYYREPNPDVQGGYRSVDASLVAKIEAPPSRLEWFLWDATAVAAVVGSEPLGEIAKTMALGFVEAPAAEAIKQAVKLVVTMIPLVGYFVNAARQRRFGHLRHEAGL